MGLAKWILRRFSCKSSCTFNPDEEYFCRESMSKPLSEYNLKFKDVKRIMSILNKRNEIKCSSNNIEI